MIPALGVCYYPEQWPEEMWADDARRMVELGLKLVRIGEFAWSRIEPREGTFDWDWLDRAIDILGSAGLEIILGTPTATPPRWMIDKFPDMLAKDANDHPRKFGSRRHYCFSHDGYRTECVRIARELGERYGRNPHVTAWQIDNEYGCHETTVSYSFAAKQAFQLWLTGKYENINMLNRAWGNVFWSMEYEHFLDIDLPNLTVTEANPAHVMDFRRFSSDQVTRFNHAQCDALRKLTDKPLIHNYMGGITDFDHFDVGRDLDIASWDAYPLGFLEDRVPADETRRHDYMRQGDPDYQAFHHDLYRAVGQGHWGVMEQQPGPVNWAPYNPAPLPGMVRLWSWEAIAHGAEFVKYFRWRQAPFGQEQMHAGLLRSDDAHATGFAEVSRVGAELKSLGDIKHGKTKVAIVFDYASAWAWETQPQGQNFSYLALVFDMYRELRRLGLSVDIIPTTTHHFGPYQCVLIPGLFSWTPQLRRAMIQFKGQILVGPRTGSKTPDFQTPRILPPDIPGLEMTVTHVESLRPNAQIPLSSGGHVHSWFEHLDTAAEIRERTTDGSPVLAVSDKLHYLGSWPDRDALRRILSGFVETAGITTMDLPIGLRVRDFGQYRLYMNYSANPVFAPHTQHTLKIEPAGILIIDRNTHTVVLK